MADLRYLEEGEIGLVMITNGKVAQIGLTPEQSAQVKFILSTISQDKPLVIMGEEHDLVRKDKVYSKEEVVNLFLTEGYSLPLNKQARKTYLKKVLVK